MNVRYPNDRILAAELRWMALASPHVAPAVFLRLAPEDWYALRTQDAFDALSRKVGAAAVRHLRGQPLCAASAADVAQAVLCRLPELDWMRRFDPAEGTGADYFAGVAHFQARDEVRRFLRQKRRRLPGLPDGLQDGRRGPEAAVDDADYVARLRALALRLPPDVRAALYRTYPGFGGDELGRCVRGDPARCVAGVAQLRALLGLPA